MKRNIPQIRISEVTEFNAIGKPDKEIIEVFAYIDTPTDFTPFGTIRFESPEGLLALHNALGSYIRMNALDHPDDDAPEEKEESSGNPDAEKGGEK